MICIRCAKESPDSPYCPMCGWKQEKAPPVKHKRGNGEGSIYKLPNGKYKAVVILGYYRDEENRLHKRTRSRVYAKRKDAVNKLPDLFTAPDRKPKPKTLYEVYQAWLPTHKAGASTMGNYKAAWKYLEPLWFIPMPEIEVDDLQECIDDCPRGKRTKENIRALLGLMYKYAVPRHLTSDTLNLAQYLTVDGENAAHRDAFTDTELDLIWQRVDDVPYASDILIMCYTGFRPSEYLALTAESYDSATHTLTGGAKTEAGRCRKVTIAPKILPLVERCVSAQGPLCKTPEGGAWGLREFYDKAFYPALEQCGISNPMVEIAGGVSRHRLTPHSCRHTFATMLKRVSGAEKDLLELMGHTSSEMLRYYQDVDVDDLKRITDQLK